MLNKVILMGRLTQEPELRHTQSNRAVASFSLAVERDMKNAQGERDTDFLNCVAWGKTAEFITQWFSKGSMMAITGRLQSRKYEDKEGNKRTAYECVAETVNFCGEKRDEAKPMVDSEGFSDSSENVPF